MPKQASKRDLSAEFDEDSSDLESLVGYNLKRAYVTVHAEFTRAVGKDDMSGRIFSALSLTVQFPNITQSELARMLGIERSGLVAMVDELEGKGFLRRAAVPGDRRVQALVPTDAGRRAYAKALADLRANEKALFAHMPQEEVETLLTLLKKVRRARTET
jgi:DNA-binding MarR family transcriptional regulator